MKAFAESKQNVMGQKTRVSNCRRTVSFDNIAIMKVSDEPNNN